MMDQKGHTMKAYRLYTTEIENDITDFNDNRYLVLEEYQGTALVLNTTTGQYIVAIGIQYEKLDSIHWAHGHYFDDHTQASDYYRRSTDEVYDFLRMRELDHYDLEEILRYTTPELAISVGLFGALYESARIYIRNDMLRRTQDVEADEHYECLEVETEEEALDSLVNNFLDGMEKLGNKEYEIDPIIQMIREQYNLSHADPREYWNREDEEGEEDPYKKEDLEWALDMDLTDMEMGLLREYFPDFYQDPRGYEGMKRVDPIIQFLRAVSK